MWYLWLIFVIIAVLIPVGIMSMAVKAAKPYRNDKQKIKVISCNVIKYCLFYWLCDLFFMSFIIDNLVCKFIFGGLIMLIIFYNLSNVFVAGKKNSLSHFAKWGMMQDFVLGVGLSIYLIYIIPNTTNLQNIIIPIVAGVYGGLLTLVGVAWAIRENEERNIKKSNKIGVFSYMLRETIRVCEDQEIFFNKDFFEKYILPKIDGEKASRDDVTTSRICNNPFVYDKQIINFAIEGEISDKMFQVYDILKNSYKKYIQMRVTFYDHSEVYQQSQIEYLEALTKAKKLVEPTNE